MDRAQMISAIEAIYAARMRGDVEGMEAQMAPDATFRFAGESAMQDGFDAMGAIPFRVAVRTLDKNIAMNRVTNRTSLVEGNRVAAIWDCEVQFANRPPLRTEIFNLFTFDETGKITDLTEFVDTATLASEVRASQMSQGSARLQGQKRSQGS